MHAPNPYAPPPPKPGKTAVDAPAINCLAVATHWSLVAALAGVGIGVLSHVFRELGPEYVSILSHDGIFTISGCTILSCVLLLRFYSFPLLPALVALFIGLGCAWVGMAVGWTYSFWGIRFGFIITRAFIWHEFLKLALVGWNIAFVVGACLLCLKLLPKFTSRSR